ncbi:MAG: BspA family leucine-rich repeat surface protein [Lachnospiraceae bacterium]|nr:BspA family leucine-rich repeat surface protein [Lachnospiraceae bacterium]
MFRKVHTSPHIKRAGAFIAALLIAATSVPGTVMPLYVRAAETASAASDTSSRKIKDSLFIEVREALPENYSWINDYAYSLGLSDDGKEIVTLYRCAAKGDATVYGCALIDNIPYRVVIAKRCFTDCPELTSLKFEAGCGLTDCPEEAKTMKAIAPSDSSRLFAGDTALTALDLRGLDFSRAEDISSLAEGDEALTSFKCGNLAPGSAIPGASVSAAAMFKNCKNLPEIDLTSMDTSAVTSMASMFLGCSAASKISFGEAFDTSRVTDMSNMFAGDRTVKEFSFGPAFSTSSVTNMSGMFAGTACALDLRKFNTASVTSMANMFRDRMGNGTIDLSSFNTKNVTDMSYMFALKYGSPAITFGGNWSVANVTNAEGLFAGYGRTAGGEAPTEDITFAPFISRFCFAQPISLNCFFKDSGFTSIDLKAWAGLDIRNCAHMFEGSRYLKNIDLQKVNTAKVQSMSYMFADCSALTGVEGADTFSTAGCIRLDHIFYNCSSIERLGFTNKDFSKVLYMDHMFDGCVNAQIINISDYKTIDYSRLISAADLDGKDGYLSSKDAMCYNGDRFRGQAKEIQKRAGNGLPDQERYIYPYYHVTDSRGMDQYEPVYEETPMTVRILSKVDYTDGRQGFTAQGFAGPLALCDTEILSTCINHVSARDATAAIRATWFCPNDHIDPKTNKPYTTRGRADTNYYEIYGGVSDGQTFVYNPTQDEWNQTYTACTLNSIPTTETAKDASGNPQIIIKAPDRFDVYGMDITENRTHKVTLTAPAYNMTGDSGISHMEEIDPADYPIFPVISERTFTYGSGNAAAHKLPALKQKGFRFLGWFDQNNKKVSASDGTCIPDGKTDQTLTPRFQIRESKIILNAGTLPEGFDVSRTGIRVKAGQEKLWHGSNGTFYAITTVGDGLFSLPEAIIPPIKSDEKLAVMETWHDDNGFIADGVQGPPVRSTYVFDHEQVFPNYSASWTTKVLTEEEKAGLPDKVPANTGSDAGDNTGSDPAAEEKIKAAEEEAKKAKEEAQKAIDQAQKEKDEAQKAKEEAQKEKDEAQKAKEEAEAARKKAEEAHAEAMASKTEADQKAAEAEAARKEAEKARQEVEAEKAAADDTGAAEKLLAADKARQEAIEKQKEAEEALAKAQADLEKAQKAREAAEAANKTLAETNENLTKDNAALKAMNEDMKEENDSLLTANGNELKDAIEDIAKLKKQLSETNAALDALKKENEGKDKADSNSSEESGANAKEQAAAKAENEEANKEIEALKQQVLALQTQLTSTKNDLKLARSEAANAKAGQTAAQKQADTAKAQLSAAQNEAKTAKIQLTAAQNEAKTAKARLSAAQNAAKIAQGQLTAAQNEAKKAKTQLTAAQNEAKTAKGQVATARAEAKKAKADAASAKKTGSDSQKVAELTKKNKALTKELTAAQAEAKKAKEEAEAAKEAGDDSNEVADLKKKNAALTSELDSAKKELSEAKTGTDSRNETSSNSTDSDSTNSAKGGNTQPAGTNSGTNSSESSNTSGYKASAGGSDTSDTDAGANDEFMMSWLEEDENSDGSSSGDSSSAGSSYNDEGSYTYFDDEEIEDTEDFDDTDGEENDDSDSEPDKAASGFGSGETDGDGVSPLVLVFLLLGTAFTVVSIVLTIRKNRQEARRKAPAPRGRR